MAPWDADAERKRREILFNFPLTFGVLRQRQKRRRWPALPGEEKIWNKKFSCTLLRRCCFESFIGGLGASGARRLGAAFPFLERDLERRKRAANNSKASH